MSNDKDLGNYDSFGDVVSGHQGIFDGLGLKTHDSVHSEVTEDGLVLEFVCQGCGKPRQLVVEYSELVALKYGVNPAIAFQGQPKIPKILVSPINWRFVSKENAWRPDMTCDGCDFHLFVRISPSEPGKYIEAARQRGFLNPGIEQQLSMVASQAAQRARAGR